MTEKCRSLFGIVCSCCCLSYYMAFVTDHPRPPLVRVRVRVPVRVCRLCTCRLHISHLLIVFVASFEERSLYTRMMNIYNPMRPGGSQPIPPLEEWQGIAGCCSHVYCRCGGVVRTYVCMCVRDCVVFLSCIGIVQQARTNAGEDETALMRAGVPVNLLHLLVGLLTSALLV